MTLEERMEKVSRIHALVEELNQLSTDLRLAGVDVSCGPSPSRNDPLGQIAVFVIRMQTGTNVTNG